mmetsp:Transcript_48002/g.139014  ORF Transcript_48002/g.139014 Transcript_48002/m.139014 type:complete len:238 (+) Transcript_48002:314-1027(+)
MAFASGWTHTERKRWWKPTPTPRPSTTRAHWNWSHASGVMTQGLPALSDACVVPAPPWCTTQEHRGNSQACETWATKQQRVRAKSRRPSSISSLAWPDRSEVISGKLLPTSSSSLVVWPATRSRPTSCSFAQPPMTTARWPALSTARRALTSMAAGGNPSARSEPQPMATGGAPCSRNSTSDKSGSSLSSWGDGSSSGSQAPVWCMPFTPSVLALSSRWELVVTKQGRTGTLLTAPR